MKFLVQRGDSLSVIAQREIGDAMQFFALARYNDIPAPRRMSPGIVLKIPRSLKIAARAEPPKSSLRSSSKAPVRLPGAGLTLAGRRLLRRRPRSAGDFAAVLPVPGQVISTPRVRRFLPKPP